jgi:L-ascorbate metabolism protein UlaG (beta-lactamase superfamily)
MITPTYSPDIRNRKDTDCTIAFIGHSTILMNLYGSWIITDPVFSNRIGFHFM